MKNIIIALIGSAILFSCKKTGDFQLPPMDPELRSNFMDSQATAMRKGGNGHNPHDNQPPATGARVCFLIDVDGQIVSNPLWNNGNTIVCDNSGLTTTQVQSVVARVQYDVSQFSIRITTDESLYDTYPVNKRMRLIITKTAFYGMVGGVAYINSMNWFEENKQCFVFSGLLGYNTKYISDATSHELGHTANCYHHKDIRYQEDGSCYVQSEYLVGFHLMGNCYQASNPIFTVGETGCGIITDDILNINNSITQ
jgi:hypothetical protein